MQTIHAGYVTLLGDTGAWETDRPVTKDKTTMEVVSYGVSCYAMAAPTALTSTPAVRWI